jgi:uncharacterized protein
MTISCETKMILDDKLHRLQTEFRQMGGVVVAYSGGIDSTFLLKVAYDCLADKAVGVTAVSASVAKSELEEAKKLASEIGVQHVLLTSHDIEDPRYTENTESRCYFCKTNAYAEILQFAKESGLKCIVDGTNADDVGDHRPGRKAAREQGVRSPLQEIGFTKAEIREFARELGLPNWDKPAAACLSSRIPYGTQVTVKNLSQVEQAEAILKELGIRQLRVRHHDQVARIEVEPENFEIVIQNRGRIVAAFKMIGYKYVTLDLLGFRSGSLNEMLKNG